jgi:hypothetical protein
MTPERYAEIAKRAYALWELEGQPDGRDVDHWLAAEAELEATWHVEPQVESAREDTPAPPAAAAKRSSVRQRRKASASS